MEKLKITINLKFDDALEHGIFIRLTLKFTDELHRPSEGHISIYRSIWLLYVAIEVSQIPQFQRIG